MDAKTRKIVIGTVSVLIAGGAVGVGLWARAATAPVKMPASAQEAARVIAAGRLDGLDADRRSQYMRETGRLMRDMTPEERREMFEDEDLREAMRDAGRDMFDDMVRRAARGEELDFGGGPRRPRGERPELTEEQREAMEERMEQMRERMANQMKESWESGDAQSTGLRQEFFKTRGPGGGGRGG